MPGKINKKSRALKEKTHNSFLRALLFGILITAAVWGMLAVIFSLLLSLASDSTPFVNVLSCVICVISLAVGGFAVGKLEKTNCGFAALLLGCVFLAICYLVSTVFDLSKGLGVGMKTLIIILMIVSPLVGVGFSARKSTKRVRMKEINVKIL